MKIGAIVLCGYYEPYLEYCLQSIKKIVDKIICIVPSNNSSCPYLDVMKKYGAIWFKQGSTDTDFSEWRNQALKEFDDDFYICRLDADEVLANLDGTPVTRKRMEELCNVIKNEEVACIDLFTRHFIYNYFTIDGRNNGMHFTKGAIFRKKDAKEYKGKIHEYLTFNDGVPGVASSNIGPCIYHFGHCKGMENLREKYKRSMFVEDNPFKQQYDQMKCKNVDEYCAKHNIFKGSIPLIKYDGKLPRCMKLW